MKTSRTLPVIFEDTVAFLLATTYPEASKRLTEDVSESSSDLTENVETSIISSSEKKEKIPKKTIKQTTKAIAIF